MSEASSGAASDTPVPRPAGLIQRDREELQARHDARRTLKTYEQWLRRFLRFHAMRHPRTMGSAEVNAFLCHLAVDLEVSPSTQNQALGPLLFLDRERLESDLDLEGLCAMAKAVWIGGNAGAIRIPASRTVTTWMRA